MNILVLCHGGNHRSVALATELKAVRGQDAIAAGLGSNSPETINHLSAWATRIWVVDDWCLGRFNDWKRQGKLPAAEKKDAVHVGVGTDVYGSPKHPKLLQMAIEICERQGFPQRRDRGRHAMPETYAFYPERL